MLSAVKFPLDLLAGLAEVAQSLAALPAELERTLRETNALIVDLRLQLADLRSQVERVAAQLETVTPGIDRLVERVLPLVDVADGARRELALATEQLASTGRSLERALQMAAPLDQVGKRIADRLRRVTGQGGPSETES